MVNKPIRLSSVSVPAYTRLQVDDRRRQLLEFGAQLFTRHAFDELSMAAIAREAGVSKALLYHYFPSKADFFEATLRQAAEDLAARTEVDPDLPPIEALAKSLGAFLEYIEQNELAYRKLMQSATSIGEVKSLIAEVRENTAKRMLEFLPPDPPPKVQAAVRAWLWFMDGACLDWLDRRDMTRDELRDLLMGTLMGALVAAGAQPPG